MYCSIYPPALQQRNGYRYRQNSTVFLDKKIRELYNIAEVILMIGAPCMYEIVKEEITQRKQEGCIVPDYKIENKSDDALRRIYEELCTLEIRKDFPFVEPVELADILQAADGCAYKKTPSPDTLENQFQGAWLGRIIGCILGKPIERYPYGAGNHELDGWECIKLRQEGAGDNFPPTDYIRGHSTAETEYGFDISCQPSLRENIRFAESDDDIRYLVLGLLTNEKYGNDFNAEHIADMWQKYLPVNLTYTAEKMAITNSLICTAKTLKEKIDFCHYNMNPFREWIGAQIRIDHYGYYNAGDPLSAAKSAYNDAIFSHVKNGVYGAMFFAALIAAAFTEKNIRKCINIALTVIPKKSRLYADILFAMEVAETSADAIEGYKKLWERFRGLSPVHTNNNAAVCVMALLMGGGDFVQSVSIAVGAGWDTDCNGATVGSVVGAMHGKNCIPDYLSEPLHDTLYSSIPDFHPIHISECATRSYNLYLSK